MAISTLMAASSVAVAHYTQQRYQNSETYDAVLYLFEFVADHVTF